MMFVKGILIGVCVLAIGGALIGCNAGMAPSGGSDAEVKAAFDKLPLEERAKAIMGTPATAEFKANKIKEMYEKEGKPVPPQFQSGAGAGRAK